VFGGSGSVLDWFGIGCGVEFDWVGLGFVEFVLRGVGFYKLLDLLCEHESEDVGQSCLIGLDWIGWDAMRS
jgi:hypothetical protein